MTHESSNRRLALPLVSRISALAAACLGSLALLGWVTGYTVLASFNTGLAPMAPLTAALFVLFGISAFLRNTFPSQRWTYVTAKATGYLSFLAAFTIFIILATGLFNHPGELWGTLSGTSSGPPPGRLLPLVSLSCAFLSLAYVLLLSPGDLPRARAIIVLALVSIPGLMASAFILACIVGDPALYGGYILPPPLPTSLCTLFLVTSIAAVAAPAVWPPDPRDESSMPRPALISIPIVLLLFAGLVLLAFIYQRDLQSHAADEARIVLASTADEKAAEFRLWRNERTGEGETLQENEAFARLVARVLDPRDDGTARAEMLSWLRQLQEAYAYERITLYDTSRTELLTYPVLPDEADSLLLSDIGNTLRSQAVSFHDFHLIDSTGRSHFVVLVPIVNPVDRGAVSAVVAMRRNPDTDIFPLLSENPWSVRSGQNFLVTREGENVLVLNHPGGDGGASFGLRLPLTHASNPIVMAGLGKRGYIEGIGHEGMHAMAYVRDVPGTSWILLTRIDRAEIYASVAQHLWINVSLLCVFLAGSLLVAASLGRQQKIQFYRNQYEAVRERAWLQDVIARSVNEIYIFDPETLHILFANAAAQRNTGYSEVELTARSMADICEEYEGGTLRAAFGQAHNDDGQGLVMEGDHLRKDGSRYPVDIHIQVAERPGGHVYLAVTEDITKRKKAEELLHLDSEIMAQMADGVSLVRAEDGVILQTNERMESMFGYRPGELVSQRVPVLNAPSEKSPEETTRMILAELHQRGRWQGEVLNTTKEGTPFWCEVSVTPFNHPVHGLVWVSVNRDITERKKGAEELTRSELRYRTLFEKATEGIVFLSADLTISMVNESFARMHGYTVEEMRQIPLQSLDTPDTYKRASALAADVFAGRTMTFEVEHYHKDGHVIPMEVSASLVSIGGEQFIQAFHRDITERKRAARQLAESEELFRLIAESIDDMIVVRDLEGKKIYRSPAYVRWEGGSSAADGEEGSDSIHPDDRDRVQQAIRDVGITGTGHQMEYRYLRPDGTQRHLESRASAIRDEEGKIARIVVISHDTTEKTRMQERFLRSQRMESIGTLASGIAHDLNNVLSPIMISIDILKAITLDPARQKVLDTLETSARRGADIVKQVLMFGRGVSGTHVVMNIKHVAVEIFRIAEETFPKSIDVQKDVPKELWSISGDPTQMHQVFLNLMVNARDAMPGGGSLILSAENVTLDESGVPSEAQPGKYVAISIADTGTGIPVHLREKIFEPFFTTKPLGAGTGLGLSTTLAIVKNHRGFLTLESEEGKGSTFRVFLPASTETAPAERAARQADLPTGKGETILIIDDEASIQEIMKVTLRSYGYDTLGAKDGVEGIELYARHRDRIKVVITDVMMPVMDGVAATRVLRKMNPDVKIIAVSGLNSNREAMQDADVFAQAFLDKPFTTQTLLTTIAMLLRRK